MNFCISQNGYLAHIYTSDDKDEIMAWYNTSTKKTQNMYFGLLKDSGHTITDGSQVHWVTSLTNKVVDEFKYFYKSFINNWGTGGTKSLILKYPGAVFNFENPSSGYAVCERASKRMQDYFDDWPGKYFGESQLVSQTVANVNAHICAKLCAKKLQCQSFNLMTYGSATACEIFDINKTDSGIAKLIVNASHTYYKRTFA
uniref:Apple domain-containing protein n=1 Tax=Plectus sambesii TaxID=2011161 RepID=A0A914WL55_9BILA